MYVDSELLERLSRNCKTSEELWKTIKRVSDFRGKLRLLQQSMKQVEEEYQAQQRKLQLEIAAHRLECDHSITKYWPDPSGNNDSWTQCLICEGEV